MRISINHMAKTAMLSFGMARPGGYQRGGRKAQPATVEEGAAFVRAYAIKLFDKGDGRGADWPALAQLLFKAAFDVVGELPGDERMQKVLRRVEVGAYDRLAGNGDDGLPSPVQITRPAENGQDLHRTPEPKFKH